MNNNIDFERSHPEATKRFLNGEKYTCSTFIDDVTTTYGYGILDDYGSWEFELYFKEN